MRGSNQKPKIRPPPLAGMANSNNRLIDPFSMHTEQRSTNTGTGTITFSKPLPAIGKSKDSQNKGAQKNADFIQFPPKPVNKGTSIASNPVPLTVPEWKPEAPPKPDSSKEEKKLDKMKIDEISTEKKTNTDAAKSGSNLSRNAPVLTAAATKPENVTAAAAQQPILTHNSMEPVANKESSDYDVMISYSHKDMDLMRYIREALKQGGIKVWVDEEGLGAGVDFLSKIGKAIVDSTCFLQILTESSVVSKYCKDELSLAYISNKPIHVISSMGSDELFAMMDFGQKLTLAPYKSQFVEITDVRFKKSQVEFMCKQLCERIDQFRNNCNPIKYVLSSHNLSKNDMSAEAFWGKYFPSRQACNWDEFLQIFLNHFGQDFEFSVPEKDKLWLIKIFESELCDDKRSNPHEVTVEDLKAFCAPPHSISPRHVWDSVQNYAREQLAIKAVFAIDSSVRLDAIENLGKFKSNKVEEALLDLLKDPDPNVRSVAALSLAKVTLDETYGQSTVRVAKLLSDSDRLVRESACVALGRMKATDQVDKLINVWRNDVISVVRDAAYLALNLIGGEAATRAIYVTKVLSDEIKALTS